MLMHNPIDPFFLAVPIALSLLPVSDEQAPGCAATGSPLHSRLPKFTD